MKLRILLLGDTHVGFDLPRRTSRVPARRRGKDFLLNYCLALQPALRGQVDAVIHAGDVFNRSRNPDWLVNLGIEPLLEVASAGVPVFVVPGNHERGHVPVPLLCRHPNLRVFDEPRSFVVEARGVRVALGGFPFVREVRGQFAALVEKTGVLAREADAHVVAMHEAFEGAAVGAGAARRSEFVFRRGPDVIAASELPTGLTCVVSGHIHRAQVLEAGLDGAALHAPVIYAGSVERTSFAERYETKGYRILTFDSSGLVDAGFHPLPSRPMEVVDLETEGLDAASALRLLRFALTRAPQDAVVRVRVVGPHVLSAREVRSVTPPSMTVEMSRPRPRAPQSSTVSPGALVAHGASAGPPNRAGGR
jgi:DNA repair protein SbcD/Mre11